MIYNCSCCGVARYIIYIGLRVRRECSTDDCKFNGATEPCHGSNNCSASVKLKARLLFSVWLPAMRATLNARPVQNRSCRNDAVCAAYFGRCVSRALIVVDSGQFACVDAVAVCAFVRLSASLGHRLHGRLQPNDSISLFAGSSVD